MYLSFVYLKEKVENFEVLRIFLYKNTEKRQSTFKREEYFYYYYDGDHLQKHAAIFSQNYSTFSDIVIIIIQTD